MRTWGAAEGALTSRGKPPAAARLVERARAAWAITWRDYRHTRSYRFALTLDLLFGLVTLLIYFYISRTFRGATHAHLAGAPSYFAFAAVGVSLMVVIQGASVALARRLRDEQLTGTLEMLTAQPLGATETSLGLAGFPFLFAMCRGALYLLVAYALLGLDLSRADVSGCVIVFVLTGLAVAGIGVASAAFVLMFKRGGTIVPLTTLFLGLGGGAFFPTDVLPKVVQPLADAVPTRFAFDGMRSALFRGEGWGGDALALLAFGITLLPIAVLGFDRALRAARTRGSVAEY
jgi:ABC-2 type transport system permease protein